MQIKKARFVTSVAAADRLYQSSIPEIAVAGKSNVGKSSFINFLTDNNKLARTSKEPGRTRLLNYFLINDDQFMLVDLPGYGFATVSDSEKENWGKLIDSYLRTSSNLKNVFLLVDIRHEPGANDIQLVNYLLYYNIPFTIICTKADKLSKNRVISAKKIIANTFKIGIMNILVTSSTAKSGKDEVLNRIEQILSPV